MQFIGGMRLFLGKRFGKKILRGKINMEEQKQFTTREYTAEGIDQEKIMEIISDYEYSRSNLLDGDVDIMYNPDLKQVSMNPFTSHGSDSKQGTCIELMEAANRDMKKYFPNHHFMRTIGKDNKFFNGDDSVHGFLLALNGSIINDLVDYAGGISTHEALISMVRDTNPLVIDPSFGNVTPLSESGYQIDQLLGPSLEVNRQSHMCIHYGRTVPLGIDSQGRLISFGASEELDSVIGVGVRELSAQGIIYNVQQNLIDHRLRDEPEMLKYVEFFRNQKLQRTDKNLMESN
jgi:hypothetical protein